MILNMCIKSFLKCILIMFWIGIDDIYLKVGKKNFGLWNFNCIVYVGWG